MDRLREATHHAPQQEEMPLKPQKKPSEISNEGNFQKICCLFVEEFKIKDEGMKSFSSRFKEDLGRDSVDAIRAIMILEEGLNLGITEKEADGVVTLSEGVEDSYER